MTQVSEIIVRWTPETSGRVGSIQIQSRIAGQTEWTEQAAGFDPTIGEFRFTANAPATKVEVRARFRNTDGVFGGWLGREIITAATSVDWAKDVIGPGKPADNATVGAPNGTVIGTRPVEDVLNDLDGLKGGREQLPDLITSKLQKPIDDLAALNLTYGSSVAKASKALSANNLVAIRKLETRILEDGTKIAEDILELTSRIDDTDAVVEAGLREVRQTITDQESATSEEIDTKIANFGRDVSAWQVEEQRVRSEQDQALAESINEMGVRVGDTEGRIAEIESIVADEDGATAESVRELGVRLDAAEGAIRTVEKATTDGDKANADRIDTISSSVEGITGPGGALSTISGTLQTLQQTQADENDARVREITTLQSKLGDSDVASLEEKLETTASKVDGLGAQYTLKLQVEQDGQLVVAGGGIAIENGVSSISWLADSFRVMTPGASPRQVFYADANGLLAPELTVGRLTYGALVDQFAGTRNNLDPNGGWQDIPGGLIVQWGRYRGLISRESSFSIVFPKAFPNQCFMAIPIGYIGAASSFRDLWVQNVGAPSSSGATFFAQAATSDNRNIDGIDWIAFGM